MIYSKLLVKSGRDSGWEIYVSIVYQLLLFAREPY